MAARLGERLPHLFQSAYCLPRGSDLLRGPPRNQRPEHAYQSRPATFGLRSLQANTGSAIAAVVHAWKLDVKVYT